MRASFFDRLLGEVVRECRLDAQHTQQDLADRMSKYRWYQSTVNKVETGLRPFSLDEAIAVSRIYGIHLSDIASMAAP